MRLHVDAETFSRLDLKKVGVYRYSEEAEVLMVSYAYGSDAVTVWDATENPVMPEVLRAGLEDARIMKCAFNANFERTIFERVLGIPCPATSWQCTMVHGFMLGLGGTLDQMCKRAGLAEEYWKSQGKRLMRKFSFPCKPTKAHPTTRWMPSDAPEDWQAYKDYCAQDTVAERALARVLPTYPYMEHEWELWALDQEINDRGVAVDMDLALAAISIDDDRCAAMLIEAKTLTGLDNPNSVEQLKRWLLSETGEAVESLAKANVVKLLGIVEPGKVARMLELRQQLSKTSIDKYRAIARSVCKDHRVRGLVQFSGATRTHRWAGRLIQVHNLPKNTLADLDLARKLTLDRDVEMLDLLYGNTSDILSQLIRTAFVPPAGSTLAVWDFSAIEARVISWFAGEEWRLEVFRTHGKIYEASAAQMFGVPFDTIVKGHGNYVLRQKGKIAELALGFQGATGALITMGALLMGIKEEELPGIVLAWRIANPMIVKLWADVELAAKTAIRNGEHGQWIGTKYWGFKMINGALHFKLPSGRHLVYHAAKLARGRIVFWGQNQKTKQWQEQETYGGSLVENMVQATARDCLALILRRLRHLAIVMHVHDEAVFEVFLKSIKKRMAEIEIAFTTPIPWAPGLPMGAVGFNHPYYKKDDS